MTINLEMNEAEATLVWWSLWTQHLSLDMYVKELRHRQALPEAVQEALWERDRIKDVVDRLTALGNKKDALDLQSQGKP